MYIGTSISMVTDSVRGQAFPKRKHININEL